MKEDCDKKFNRAEINSSDSLRYPNNWGQVQINVTVRLVSPSG